MFELILADKYTLLINLEQIIVAELSEYKYLKKKLNSIISTTLSACCLEKPAKFFI